MSRLNVSEKVKKKTKKKRYYEKTTYTRLTCIVLLQRSIKIDILLNSTKPNYFNYNYCRQNYVFFQMDGQKWVKIKFNYSFSFTSKGEINTILVKKLQYRISVLMTENCTQLIQISNDSGLWKLQFTLLVLRRQRSSTPN